MRPTPPSPVASRDGLRGQLQPVDFADHFSRSYARLWALAAGILGDRDEAEDVVQEAALIALRRLDQFTPGTNFLAWMAKIVRLQSYNWSRKKTGRRTEPADPMELDRSHADSAAAERHGARPPGPADDLTNYLADFDDHLMHALESLKPEVRACLLLRTIHLQSYRDIAEMMELPEGTVMSHVHRAKKSLRQRLASAFAGTAPRPK